MGLTKKPETKVADEIDTAKLFDEIVDYFTRVEKHSINMIHRGLTDKSVVSQMVENYLQEKEIPTMLIPIMQKMFEDYVFGYQILEPLIDDVTISDI